MKHKEKAIEILEACSSSYTHVDIENLAMILENIEKNTVVKILKELMLNSEYTFDLAGKPIVKINSDFELNICNKYGIKWA